MKRETELDLIQRLLRHVDAGTTSTVAEEGRLDVAHYLSPERFAAETGALFRPLPSIIAHTSEVARPGDVLTHDALGVPIVLSRDREGTLRAFLNVCRHRGFRVAREERASGKKALVCGYHGWSYELDGSLLHMPHADGFPRTDCDRALVQIPVSERGGFVWVTPAPRPGCPTELDAFLGGLADELEGLGLATHSVYRSTAQRRRFHWKLLIDAFLDGYHLKYLHKDTVYRFFVDNVSVSDPFGAHLRSVVARRSIAEARTTPEAEWRLRDYLSLTYFLFPSTILVFHPDWVSRITLFPLAVDETLFVHTMLIPPGEDVAERRPHWDKTWSLIQEGVFEREDIAAAESIQTGLASGANATFTLGRFEWPLRAFHDQVDRAISASGQS
jgi:phenylpropionate dioxygenase-like ring-hydroxylating dioxygenase large terminal subunit